jgi:hypothetical protein
MTNSVAQSYTAPDFKFGSANVGFTLFKKLSFTISTNVAYQSDYGKNKEKIIQYSNSASLYSKWGGVQVLFEQIPVFDYSAKGSSFAYYQNLFNIGPFISANFLRKQLQFRAQYNYSKSAPGDVIRENATASLSYVNKSAVRVNLTVSSAINAATNYSYGQLTVRMPINIPKPKSRKYYNLKILIYEDVNKNDIKDKHEPVLKNVEIWINNQPYITSNKGIVEIKNTENGEYVSDFHTMGNMLGLIPSNGFKQILTVKGNTNYELAFKKGRMIEGEVKVILDSISNQKFYSDYLKITVTDSSGEKFSTLTDRAGKFSIAVPGGKYFVSLNPAAFDDVFKPVQMAFTVDLINNESASVTFEIRQRQRKVQKIKAEINGN